MRFGNLLPPILRSRLPPTGAAVRAASGHTSINTGILDRVRERHSPGHVERRVRLRAEAHEPVDESAETRAAVDGLDHLGDHPCRSFGRDTDCVALFGQLVAALVGSERSVDERGEVSLGLLELCGQVQPTTGHIERRAQLRRRCRGDAAV